MRTLDESSTSYDAECEVPNPLLQCGVAWQLLPGDTVLPPQGKLESIRFADPGAILRLVADTVGPPTALCVLADNVAGAASWQTIPFERQYQAIRTGTGAFLCGAMRYLSIRGPQAALVLDALTPKDIFGLPAGRATFALFTTSWGTVDNEAVILRIANDHFLVSLGGGARRPSWLAEALRQYPDATVTETEVSSFNLKGPGRLAAMRHLLDPADSAAVGRLRPFDAVPVRTAEGLPAWVVRTVIGYEMWAAPEAMRTTWTRILASPGTVTPAGWDLLNTYRLECDEIVFGLFPLELHTGTTLWELGHDRMATSRKGRDFIGRTALDAHRENRRLWLAGLAAQNPHADVPTVGTEIRALAGELAGYVTSAVFSPRRARPVAFAHLSRSYPPGSRVTVDGAMWAAGRLPLP